MSESSLTQEEILLKFIQDDKAMQWAKKRKGWAANEGQVCTDWQHVECDPYSNEITKIFFPEQELTATIPTEIGLLTSLTDLNFESNFLHGSLPKEIFDRLPNLINVNFNHNNLDGTLPQLNPKSLQSVRTLKLDHNRLYGVIWDEIGEVFAESMEQLDLSHNGFDGTIPDSITKLEKMIYLDLSFNLLDGSIPKDIGALKNLRGLFLNNNDLIGTIPPSMTLSDLKLIQIFLEANALSGTIPAGLADLSHLTDLFVDGNKFTGTVPTDLCKRELNQEFFEGQYDQDGRDGCTSISCPVNTVSREGVHPCYTCGAQGMNPYLGLEGGRCFHANQKQILDIFYDNTDGMNWHGGYGWGQENAPVCGYEGVMCNQAGQVVNITLRGMNLNGPISEELGFLQHLKILDLADNSLRGYLPSDLRFAPLEYLDISNNNLIGFVPPMLCLTGDINHNGDGGVFHCDYIACPAGTYHPAGRMFDENIEGGKGMATKCIPCNDGQPYLGRKSCDSPVVMKSIDASRKVYVGVVAGLLAVCITMATAVYILKKRRKVASMQGHAQGGFPTEEEFPFGSAELNLNQDNEKLIRERGTAEHPRSDLSSPPDDAINRTKTTKDLNLDRMHEDESASDPLFEVKGLFHSGAPDTIGSDQPSQPTQGSAKDGPDDKDSSGDGLWLDVPKII